MRLAAALLLVLTWPAQAACPPGTTSRLWGVAGELWDPAGRLPDVSRAGYREGLVPLPRPPLTHDVRDFGAVGDGVTDDIAAFRAALASGRVVFVPAGRYLLSDALSIERSDVILRGAGPEQTVLYFIKPVSQTTSPCRRQAGAGGWFGGLICVGHHANVEEVGVEELAIEFPPSPDGKTPGHHEELGWNGITFGSRARHSWVRNVTIADTDNGHYIAGGRHITMTGLAFRAKSRTGRRTSHHFLGLQHDASYNLITGFSFDREAFHELMVTQGAHHNVYSRGSGPNIRFDHHGEGDWLPHDNVFSDIVYGQSEDLWELWVSGGNPALTPPFTGPREVFWNIRTAAGRGPSTPPRFGYSPSGSPFAPLASVVGATYENLTDDFEWMECIDRVEPPDIHAAQVAATRSLPPPLSPALTVDIDGDGETQALTEGLLIFRWLLGLTGTALTHSAVDLSDCTRCTAETIEPLLATRVATGAWDIDGDGETQALTDGLLILRWMLGLTGGALISAVVDLSDCTRCGAAAIEEFLGGLR